MAPKENVRADAERLQEIPAECGVQIRLQTSGLVNVEYVKDDHFPQIHPNCYAPADLKDVQLLKGGGSGAAVFHGSNTELGSIVMKHAGAKDTREVFSLVTIRQELERRGEQRTQAAQYLQKRIPEFVMVYISPHHVRNRTHELWNSLRNTMQRMDGTKDAPKSSDTSPIPQRSALAPLLLHQHSSASTADRRSVLANVHDKQHARKIAVGKGEELCIHVTFGTLTLYIPGLHADGSVDRGLEFLQMLSKELAEEQERNLWKFTIAQKTIGGEHSENGASVLTSGKVKGAILDVLVIEFTTLMRNLKELTLPDERECVHLVKSELERLSATRDVSSVPKFVDQFVGNAIIKNYQPETGRFAKLREFGQCFRNEDLYLTDEEVVPARYLGLLLERGTLTSRVFSEPSLSSVCALDMAEDMWLDLLEHASTLKYASATDRLWTCGLTDAGLHNTFLSEERGLELFDLGAPTLTPMPAFLTKFLMSFFHTLGMEENASGCHGTEWVIRFWVENGKAAFTDDTSRQIPYVYEAFQYATNHFISHLFDGDENVRTLLKKYVVLQLLSDAAFCLKRWEEKGGGVERYGSRVSLCLEKWLWRSLWDLFIASHVYEKLILSHPSLDGS